MIEFVTDQTGSGKTYTMWGSTQDLLAQSPCNERGLTPRVFERLFERIKEVDTLTLFCFDHANFCLLILEKLLSFYLQEEQKNTDKQLHYQCRCSFLEV